MRNIANLRAFIESAQAVVKASQIEPDMLKAVFSTLAQVVTDVTGHECELVLRFKLGAQDAAPDAGGARP